MMTMDDRFVVNAALERMLADGDTFDPADARLVIDRVPLSRGGMVEGGLTFDAGKPPGGVEGHAPGIGNVHVGEGGPRLVKVSHAIERTRVGGYKVVHRPGRMLIELMWSETMLDPDGKPRDGREATLSYDRRTREPRRMRISRSRTYLVVLWPWPRIDFDFHLTLYHPWKVPTRPGRAGNRTTKAMS